MKYFNESLRSGSQGGHLFKIYIYLTTCLNGKNHKNRLYMNIKILQEIEMCY